MAVRFMDGCEHYPNTETGILYKYDGRLTPMKIREDDGRLGGDCLGTTSSFGGFVSKTLPDQSLSAYHVVAAAVQTDNFTSSGTSVFMTARPANPASGLTTTWSLIVADTGVLTLETEAHVSLVAQGDVRITTASGVYTSAVYHFIEVELFVDPSVGYIRLWVDDVNVGEVTGADTTSWFTDPVEPVAEFALRQTHTWDTRFDDIHVLDGSGSFNTSRVGDTQVKTVYPVTDGNTVLFTPLTGTNQSQVSELKGDGDTSFVESGTVKAKDIYDMAALSGDTVFAVQPLALAKKTTTENIKGSVIASDTVTDFIAATRDVQTDYKYMHGVLNSDPVSGLNWDADKVNTLEFGFKLESKT